MHRITTIRPPAPLSVEQVRSVAARVRGAGPARGQRAGRLSKPMMAPRSRIPLTRYSVHAQWLWHSSSRQSHACCSRGRIYLLTGPSPMSEWAKG